MSIASYRYNRADFQALPVTLRHLDIRLDFHPEHVDGIIVLHMIARAPMSETILDARDLSLSEVAVLDPSPRAGETLTSLTAGHEAALSDVAQDCQYSVDGHSLKVTFPRTYEAGETIRLRCRARSIPSDQILEGIYRDTTPAGAPPQFMSQCQQWGFQRFLPIYDDCTAKCTMVTTLTGDARYTHMISNGNICANRNPGGSPVAISGDASRRTITFINPIPMAPYLFIACAGTWELLEDHVDYPDGQRVKLEYLVEPGRLDGARMPMEILKHSVLWQNATQDYAYRHDVYRTITMDKSNFGGMENVGNTTIVTDAALIDDYTSDRRLEYAHGVILHEFEHNQCGSDVTMETPFDMWLNEAFTVDVERQYLSSVFDPAAVRLDEVDDIRSPIGGPLAIEDAGHLGNIVRDGFNDPDELVDGVTYVKAAEVVRMLRLIIGQKAFHAGKTAYFERHDGANANTDQFFACFEESSGRDLSQFKREWLYTIGYPQISAETHYDNETRRLRITFQQSRSGRGGLFHLPIVVAAVDEHGADMFERVIELDGDTQSVDIDNIDEPAVVSINRDASFYGTFSQSGVGTDVLARQVRLDSNAYNRVEAMRQLTDVQRLRLMADPAVAVDDEWLALYSDILTDTTLAPGLKAYLLRIDEQSMDREQLPRYRERNAAYRALLKAVAEHALPSLMAVFNATDTYSRGDTPCDGLDARRLKGVLLRTLSAANTAATQTLAEAHFNQAWNFSDKVSALTCINQSDHPNREAIMEATYEAWKDHSSAYAGYLMVVASGTHGDVFAAMAREELRSTFDLRHPTLNRALLMPMASNNDQLWTTAGLNWLAQSVLKLSRLNEYVSNRLVDTVQLVHQMPADLKADVLGCLQSMSEDLDASATPSVAGRVATYLSGVHHDI